MGPPASHGRRFCRSLCLTSGYSGICRVSDTQHGWAVACDVISLQQLLAHPILPGFAPLRCGSLENIGDWRPSVIMNSNSSEQKEQSDNITSCNHPIRTSVRCPLLPIASGSRGAASPAAHVKQKPAQCQAILTSSGHLKTLASLSHREPAPAWISAQLIVAHSWLEVVLHPAIPE